MNTAKKIVVIGGGAGGLELIARLAKKYRKNSHISLTLIDASPIHLWKPLLHEAAAGTLNSYADELNYLNYANMQGFHFYLGTLKNLNRKRKIIYLAPVFDQDEKEIIPAREIPYDILIIAIGSVSNDFHIKGVREYCRFIDNADEALDFQKQFLKIMMSLPYQSSETLTIGIVGCGATGVELAAELHYAIQQMADLGFQLDLAKIHFTLIEAGPRILPALTERLANTVTQELQKLGMTIFANEKVIEVNKEGFLTASQNLIPAQLKIWAAGIKAPQVLKNLDGLQVNHINQLIVKSTLQTTYDDCIFALGDCASAPQKNSDKPVPPRAAAAHQQAIFLTKAIDAYLNEKPLPNFHFHDYGSLISISHYETIGNLMGRITKSLMIEGKFARLAYLSLYRLHQSALFGPWRVFTLMLANFLTRRIKPRLKLH